MACAASAALLTAAWWTFEWPVGPLARWLQLARPTVTTAGLLVVLGLLCAFWRTDASSSPARTSRAALWTSLLLAVAAAWMLGHTVSRWIDRIVVIAIDPYRADMLVQIDYAVRQFLSGGNPYRVYHVPWELPLSYGPALWMWYIVPHVARADLRLVTIAGQLFAASLLVVAAATDVSRGRYLHGILLAVVASLVLLNPGLDRFLVIGHTPAYWPLLGLFALLTSARRHLAAAVLLALLLAARTTMVAVVPVFLIYLWRTDRRAIPGALVLIAITLAVTVGPFLLLDWRIFVYGLYGNYVRVITEHVWPNTDGMHSTIGLSRLLVASGLSGYVMPAQALAMAVTWGLTWLRLRPGDSPAPWFLLALTVFCMTTLWPVWYTFLDGFVLGLCFLAADHVPELRRAPWASMLATTALAVATVMATLVVNPGVFYSIEACRSPLAYLRAGFGPDEHDGARGFVWARRERVHLHLPRGFATGATLRIECEPFMPPGAPVQTLGVSINGSAVGQVALRTGWQVVEFDAPRRVWRAGQNVVMLHFRYALPIGGEPRAARIGRVSIEP